MTLTPPPDDTPTWQDKVTIYDKGLIIDSPLTLNEKIAALETWGKAGEVSRWAIAQLVKALADEDGLSEYDIHGLTGLGVGTIRNYKTLLTRFPQNADDPDNLPLVFSAYMLLNKRSDKEVETVLLWAEDYKRKDIHDSYPSVKKIEYYIAIEFDKETPESWETVSDERSPDGRHRFITMELKEVDNVT